MDPSEARRIDGVLIPVEYSYVYHYVLYSFLEAGKSGLSASRAIPAVILLFRTLLLFVEHLFQRFLMLHAEYFA